MPPHAIQLTPTERWTAILHVRVLQNKYTEFPRISLDETKQALGASDIDFTFSTRATALFGSGSPFASGSPANGLSLAISMMEKRIVARRMRLRRMFIRP